MKEIKQATVSLLAADPASTLFLRIIGEKRKQLRTEAVGALILRDSGFASRSGRYAYQTKDCSIIPHFPCLRFTQLFGLSSVPFGDRTASQPVYVYTLGNSGHNDMKA